MYIPRRTAFTAAPPGCEARSEDRRRHRAAEERSSARLVASKAGFRGSVMHGCHAALTAQCAVGAVLHPRSTPCAIRLRRAQLLRFPDNACARRCVRRLFNKRIAWVRVSLQSHRIHRSSFTPGHRSAGLKRVWCEVRSQPQAAPRCVLRLAGAAAPIPRVLLLVPAARPAASPHPPPVDHPAPRRPFHRTQPRSLCNLPTAARPRSESPRPAFPCVAVSAGDGGDPHPPPPSLSHTLPPAPRRSSTSNHLRSLALP